MFAGGQQTQASPSFCRTPATVFAWSPTHQTADALDSKVAYGRPPTDAFRIKHLYRTARGHGDAFWTCGARVCHCGGARSVCVFRISEIPRQQNYQNCVLHASSRAGFIPRRNFDPSWCRLQQDAPLERPLAFYFLIACV